MSKKQVKGMTMEELAAELEGLRSKMERLQGTSYSTRDDGKRAVLVTTGEKRGVFFGYTDNDMGDATIHLHDARNVIYWCSAVGGVFGLAADGPKEGCRIGATVSHLKLPGSDLDSMTEASDKAAETFASFPTHTG